MIVKSMTTPSSNNSKTDNLGTARWGPSNADANDAAAGVSEGPKVGRLVSTSFPVCGLPCTRPHSSRCQISQSHTVLGIAKLLDPCKPQKARRNRLRIYTRSCFLLGGPCELGAVGFCLRSPEPKGGKGDMNRADQALNRALDSLQVLPFVRRALQP